MDFILLVYKEVWWNEWRGERVIVHSAWHLFLFLLTPFPLSPFTFLSNLFLFQVAVWYNVTGDLTCFDPSNTVTTTKPIKPVKTGDKTAAEREETARPKVGGTAVKPIPKQTSPTPESQPKTSSFLNPFHKTKASKANNNKETASSDDVCTGDLIPGEDTI